MVSSQEMEIVFAQRTQRQHKQQYNRNSKDQVCLPEPRQQVIAKVMHVIGRLIQRREPPNRHVRFVKQLVRQFKDLLEQLWIEQKPKQAERKRRRDARGLAALDIDIQHEKYHHERVEQHEQQNRRGAFIRTAQLECLDQCRQRDRLSSAGVAKNRRRLRPHVADEAIPHADDRRRSEDEDDIQHRCERDIERLPGEPRAPLHANEIIRHAHAEKRHIDEQKHQQKRNQQH